MVNRVAEFTLRDNALFHIGRNQRRVAELSAQVSSGKRVLDPGDDAIAFAKAKDLRGIQRSMEQYKANIGRAEGQLSVMDSALTSMTEVVGRAKELALQTANATMNADNRRVMATEVEHLITELVSLGNTKLDNRYLFAGFKSDAPPFDATGAYSGDSGIRQVAVGEGITVEANVPGDQILNGSGGGVDLFATLTQLRDALLANDPVAIAATIDPLGQGDTQVIERRMTNGFQINKLAVRRNTLDEISFQTQRLLSEQEDVNLDVAISELVVHQNTLEVARSTLGMVLNGNSLLDFLR